MRVKRICRPDAVIFGPPKHYGLSLAENARSGVVGRLLDDEVHLSMIGRPVSSTRPYYRHTSQYNTHIHT